MKKHPPLHLSVVAIEKGAFGSPSTTVANFTYFISLKVNIIVWLEFEVAYHDVIVQHISYYATIASFPNGCW